MSNKLLTNCIVNSNATSVTYDDETGIYTIISPKGSSTSGYGFKINDEENDTVFYYDMSYIYSFEILVPTAHNILLDYNNKRIDGGTNWNGNDNDLISARQPSSITVAANTWTKVVFGSKNKHNSNSTHAALTDYSTLGLITSNDAGPVEWYVKNFYWDIVDETKKINIGKNYILSANSFLESNEQERVKFSNLDKQIYCFDIIEV